MAERKRNKRSSGLNFALGMVVYALVFALICAVGLRLLWTFMDEYEQSRPNKTMDEYIQSLDDGHIKALAADFVATLDHNVQTEEDSYACILQAMEGKLTYAKKSAESSDTRTVYVLSLDGRKLGTVALTKEEDPAFGFSPWSVAEEEMDFSWLLSPAAEITVPENWTVYCAGNALDKSYISGEKTPYARLEEFYGEGFDLPYMVTYHVENYLGELKFELKDKDGQTAQIPEGQDLESFFADNCTEQEKAEVKTLSENFIRAYVWFMSNTNHNAYGNYYEAMQYIVPGSELDSRLYQTIEGQYYAHSRGDDIQSITLNSAMNLGGGNYFADLTYVVDTTGQKGVVQTTNNLKLIISRTDDGLKAADIASY